MKKTVVLISSNREIEQQTRDCVAELQRRGAVLVLQRDVPDVALARCLALSSVCEQLRGKIADRDIVLMLDDDMIVPPEVAAAVVDKARELARPTAAAYATKSSTLAATRWKEGPAWSWLVGLGCVAIPARQLLELEQRCESFELLGKAYTAFTWCGPARGVWVAEDYRLSMQLGGVQLLPVPAGHIKKWNLWPDAETLRKIGDGGDLT